MTISPKLKYQQTGLSIVELMVSLVLGLLLMTGVIQVFLSSRQTYATNEAIARQQENGRFALEFIARSARMAGYTDPNLSLGVTPPTPINCNGLPGKCLTLPNPPLSMSTINAGGNASDSIGFVLQPQLIDNIRRDCTGELIVNDDELVINRFEIIPNGTGTALGCRSYAFNGAAAPRQHGVATLVEGIDSLQILYGEDLGGDTRSPNSYVSADRVTDWSRVRSIRIAVLANSMNPILPAPANRNFILLDAAPLASADYADNIPRQIFTTTIQLKNTD